MRTLTSVLSQLDVDFEVIVVDDGSTDGSGDLVLDVNDSRLRYFRKENRGVSSARNYGIQISKGDWQFLLDADDELVEGTLAYWESFIKKYSSCLVFVGQESHKVIRLEHTRERRAVFPYFLIWLRAYFPSSGNMLFHRYILSKCGMMDERMSFFEDYEFGLRILLSNKVVYST